jgi:hypothetical protein
MNDDPLIWLLNQYRAAEIRGASVIMRLGRLATTSALRSAFSRHLRDEGVHAWLWTRAVEVLDGEVLDIDDPYQTRLGTHFGVPKTLNELLALTLVSERRGVATYEEHLQGPDTPPLVQRTLRGILRDEHWHVSYIQEELESRLRADASVAGVLERAEQADRLAAEDLTVLATEKLQRVVDVRDTDDAVGRGRDVVTSP